MNTQISLVQFLIANLSSRYFTQTKEQRGPNHNTKNPHLVGRSVFSPIYSSSETIYGLIKEHRTGLCSSAVLIMGSLLGMCMCVCADQTLLIKLLRTLVWVTEGLAQKTDLCLPDSWASWEIAMLIHVSPKSFTRRTQSTPHAHQRQHLFIQRYIKNNNIVKHYCMLK